MRILITLIALDHDGRVFPEGAVVHGVILGEGESYDEDEIPYALAEARVAAGSAELVVEGVTWVSSAAKAAGALMAAAVISTRSAVLAVLDAADAGDDSDKLALAEAMERYAVADVDIAERAKAFRGQVAEIREGLTKAAAGKPKRSRAKAGDA